MPLAAIWHPARKLIPTDRSRRAMLQTLFAIVASDIGARGYITFQARSRRNRRRLAGRSRTAPRRASQKTTPTAHFVDAPTAFGSRPHGAYDVVATRLYARTDRRPGDSPLLLMLAIVDDRPVEAVDYPTSRSRPASTDDKVSRRACETRGRRAPHRRWSAQRRIVADQRRLVAEEKALLASEAKLAAARALAAAKVDAASGPTPLR